MAGLDKKDFISENPPSSDKLPTKIESALKNTKKFFKEKILGKKESSNEIRIYEEEVDYDDNLPPEVVEKLKGNKKEVPENARIYEEDINLDDLPPHVVEKLNNSNK